MRRFKRDNRGSALVEFAMVLPILLFVTLVVFDLGFVVYDKLAVMAAAREGGRAAAVTVDTASGESMCRDMTARAGLDSSSVTCKVSESGSYYISQVNCRRPMLVPGLPKLLGGNEWSEITVEGEAVFRRETEI